MTNNQKMLIAISKLPVPDLLTTSKITDPIGSNVFYSARTVVRLIESKNKALALCLEYFEREIADDPTMINSDFGKAYKAVKAAKDHPETQ